EPGAVVVDQARPVSELEVVGEAALQRESLVFDLARRLARGRRVAALAVLDDGDRSLERADLAHARYVTAVPAHPEFEVLVRVEPLRVHRKLRHVPIPLSRRRSGRPSAATG